MAAIKKNRAIVAKPFADVKDMIYSLINAEY